MYKPFPAILHEYVHYVICLWIINSGWPMFKLITFQKLIKVELELAPVIVNNVHTSRITAQPRLIKSWVTCADNLSSFISNSFYHLI